MTRNDVTFYVNEEKRIVVCKYKWGLDGWRVIYGLTNKYVTDVLNQSLLLNTPSETLNNINPEQIVAKAVCSPDDTFDVNIGKAIAYHRLERKLLKFFVQHTLERSNSLKKISDSLTDKINNLDTKLEKISNK